RVAVKNRKGAAYPFDQSAQSRKRCGGELGLGEAHAGGSAIVGDVTLPLCETGLARRDRQPLRQRDASAFGVGAQRPQPEGDRNEIAAIDRGGRERRGGVTGLSRCPLRSESARSLLGPTASRASPHRPRTAAPA